MSQRFDKSRLASRHVSVGPERAPHRSCYHAMGLTGEEIARPFAALASSGNDNAPRNTTLDTDPRHRAVWRWAGGCRVGAVTHPGAKAETRVFAGI